MRIVLVLADRFPLLVHHQTCVYKWSLSINNCTTSRVNHAVRERERCGWEINITTVYATHVKAGKNVITHRQAISKRKAKCQTTASHT